MPDHIPSPRTMTPSQYKRWAEEKRHEAWARAQTGTDLIFHGAIHDLTSEEIADERSAAKFIAAAIIQELMDHGLKIVISESGNVRISDEI